MDITPITERLSVIENSVNALSEFAELTLDEFLASSIVCAAAEHYMQVAIQASLDIGGILLSEMGAAVPREYRDVFPRLAEVGVVPQPLAARLVNMAKFRNVLVHLYMEVDLERLHGYILNDLEDFREYGRYVSNFVAANLADTE